MSNVFRKLNTSQVAFADLHTDDLQHFMFKMLRSRMLCGCNERPQYFFNVHENWSDYNSQFRRPRGMFNPFRVPPCYHNWG